MGLRVQHGGSGADRDSGEKATMIRLAALVLLGMAIGAGTLAVTHAQPPTGAPRVCAPTNSEKATVAVIAADPAAWIGRCVSVEAIYAGEQLHADADAIYGVNGNSIGGYVDGQGDVGGAWRGTFTGRVADCAAAEEDLLTGLLRSPGISLHGRTLGCLEPKGPFLVFMSQGDLKPAGIKRRLPGARGGDLAAPAAQWAHADAMSALAKRFGAAMQAGDVAALKAMLPNSYMAEQVLVRDDMALAQLRSRAERDFRLFSYPAVSGDVAAGEACWCLKADCAKLWPTHGRDADNQVDRPYACIRIDGRRDKDGWRYRVDASQDIYGLQEP